MYKSLFTEESVTIEKISLLFIIFVGESMDPDAMILMLEYREVDGEEKPIMMAFKHGLREVKC